MEAPLVNTVGPAVYGNTTNNSFDLDHVLELAGRPVPPDESFGLSTGAFPPPRVTSFDMFTVGWATAVFRLVPTEPTLNNVPVWAAKMVVRCENLEEMMRDGFSWNYENNVLPAETSIRHDLAPCWYNKGFRFITTWILVDHLNPGAPRWYARLEVMTADYADLCASFNIHRLSWENICGASAYTDYAVPVYHFDRHDADKNYGDMFGEYKPVSREWPWPENKPAPATQPSAAPGNLLLLPSGPANLQSNFVTPISGGYAQAPPASHPRPAKRARHSLDPVVGQQHYGQAGNGFTAQQQQMPHSQPPKRPLAPGESSRQAKRARNFALQDDQIKNGYIGEEPLGAHEGYLDDMFAGENPAAVQNWAPGPANPALWQNGFG